MKIDIIKKDVVGLIALFAMTAHAQVPSIPGFGGDLSIPVNLGSAIQLGSTFLTNPGQLDTLVGVGSEVLVGVSPVYNSVISEGVQSVPQAFLSGTTIISPAVTAIPQIPLLNAPLPGL